MRGNFPKNHPVPPAANFIALPKKVLDIAENDLIGNNLFFSLFSKEPSLNDIIAGFDPHHSPYYRPRRRGTPLLRGRDDNGMRDA
jgi:hypothetical protein